MKTVWTFTPTRSGALLRVALMLLATMFLAAPTSASASEDDSGLWATVTLNHALDRDWTASLALQPRFFDGIDSFDRLVVRPHLTRRLGDTVALTLGYDAHLINRPSNQTEHRPWQQLAWRPRLGDFSPLLWFRLEERVLDTWDGTSLRGRFLLQHAWSTGFGPLPEFVLRNEYFVNLNEPTNGPAGGFDQNRFFAGFARTVGNSRLELGYQMQYLDRRRREDRVIHQGFVALTIPVGG